MTVVSILMPTYNGARHIRPAIESVLTQEGVDLELIVTDDNSTDGTADIVASYGDPRIRLERNPANLGPEGNWNRALELATGTYVKLLPQDDLIAPGGLAAQISVLEADKNEEIALVLGARTIVDPNDRVVMTRGLGRRKTGRVSAQWLVRACVIGGTNHIGEPGGVLFRRSLAGRVGPFDGSLFFTLDVNYWLRLLKHGDAFYIAEVVSSFRVDKGSNSVKIMKKQARDYAAFLDRSRAAGLIPDKPIDIAIGKVAAQAMMYARRIVYRFFVR